MNATEAILFPGNPGPAAKRGRPLAIILKSRREIEAIRRSGRLAREVLEKLGKMIRPGITTLKLDQEAHKMITSRGAYPSPLNYHGFPKSICTSINQVVCHGIPDKTALKEGDIINVDITARLDGYHGDCSRTFMVGQVSEEAKRLVNVTEACLMRGIEAVRPGMEVNEIGRAIQELADEHGYGVVKDFCGHGIGRNFHEEPAVLHYRAKGKSEPMRPGMVFTIEPMINIGTFKIKVLSDGWTAVTQDGTLSAQFEHTVAVTREGCDVLTALDGKY